MFKKTCIIIIINVVMHLCCLIFVKTFVKKCLCLFTFVQLNVSYFFLKTKKHQIHPKLKETTVSAAFLETAHKSQTLLQFKGLRS